MADVLAFPLDRDAVRVAGPDALTFLQGQLSQDLDGLAVGDSVESLILQPQGKVDAFVRVTRTDDDEIVLDVDGGFGAAVVDRLARFKLRTKADIEPWAWRFVAVRAADPASLAPLAPDAGTRSLPVSWPGWHGVDLAGPEAEVPEMARLGSAEEYDALRIHAGVPAMGRELTDKTIPAEAGIVERTVSFTKGCFTGQELVARIDARGGNVPRRLRGVLVRADTVPPAGTAITVDGAVVGHVTSSAWSRWARGPVALAYIARAVAPPTEADVAGAEATLVALPIPT